jgi:hypothetical protein
MIEHCRELHQESSLVSESTLDVKYYTRVLTIIAPLREHTAFELYFCHILTVNSVYRDDSLPYSPDDTLIFWCRCTTLGELVWDITGFAYYNMYSVEK